MKLCNLVYLIPVTLEIDVCGVIVFYVGDRRFLYYVLSLDFRLDYYPKLDVLII